MWIDTEADAELLVELWPDSATLSSETLAVVLGAAQEQCEHYAPALAEGATVPDGWRVALLMQARAVHRSLIAGGGDQIGIDGIAVTVYPMDRTVKGLLRPRRGVPGVK